MRATILNSRSRSAEVTIVVIGAAMHGSRSVTRAPNHCSYLPIDRVVFQTLTGCSVTDATLVAIAAFVSDYDMNVAQRRVRAIPPGAAA